MWFFLHVLGKVHPKPCWIHRIYLRVDGSPGILKSNEDESNYHHYLVTSTDLGFLPEKNFGMHFTKAK
jgi:hypothetical protein